MYNANFGNSPLGLHVIGAFMTSCRILRCFSRHQHVRLLDEDPLSEDALRLANPGA
jgi:hypothetical protein